MLNKLGQLVIPIISGRGQGGEEQEGSACSLHVLRAEGGCDAFAHRLPVLVCGARQDARPIQQLHASYPFMTHEVVGSKASR